MYYIVFILTSICYSNGLTEHRNGPGDTYVRQGETATLHCAIIQQGDNRLFWYRKGTGEILSHNEHVSQGARPDLGSYIITGNHENGEYNLQIINAQPSDADEYRCGYENDDDHNWLGAFLHVMVPPNHGYPMCLLLSERSVIGQTTKMSCVSMGGDPPATLVWERDGVPITTPKPNRNELDYVMEAEDVGASFTCHAESMAMHEMRSCSLTPLRKLPNVLVSPRVGYVTIGGSAVFTCLKQNQQPADSYVWYFNQHKVDPESTLNSRFGLSGDRKVLTVGDITEADNDADIECKVNNGSAILVGARAHVSVIDLDSVENTDSPTIDIINRRLPTTRRPNLNNNQYNLAPPTPPQHNNSKIALIAVSMLGGLAIAALAVIFYVYLQRRAKRRPRKHKPATIPMTPRSSSTKSLSSRISSSFSLKSFKRGSSMKKIWRRGRFGSHPELIISSPEAYAALNMRKDKPHNYQDLKNVASCPAFHLSTSMYSSALPSPPHSAQGAPPTSVAFSMGGANSNSNICHAFSSEFPSVFEEEEAEESNDSYETIDEKILKKVRKLSRTENAKDSGYLEILP